METVYVIDSSHPSGGYIANKADVPKGIKTLTMKQFEKNGNKPPKQTESKKETETKKNSASEA